MDPAGALSAQVASAPMAQTKKRRRRKHRGTQGGSIDTGTRRGPRPRSRAEAKAQARSQMSKKKQQARRRSQPRAAVPPTWGTAVRNAAVGAALFFAVLLLFKRPIGEAVGIAALMFAVYIPMTYTINRFFYNRRMLREQRARQGNGRS
jgi:hypothetical protein